MIRRLSLDVTGLPPALADIDRFVADRSRDAYDRLVERLLASPHYGERWARHWLDAAHYADSNGYEKDLARSIYPYRDWIIDACNNNMPFDQFAIDQLAGDLLPHATLDDKIGTGFLRNSMLNEEGGVDPEQFRQFMTRRHLGGKGLFLPEAFCQGGIEEPAHIDADRHFGSGRRQFGNGSFRGHGSRNRHRKHKQYWPAFHTSRLHFPQ